LIIQDTDFNIIYQNQVHIDLYGDHIGECCYKAFQGRDTICEGCLLNYLSGWTDSQSRDNFGHRPGVLYSELIGSPLRDSTGNHSGIKVVRDITESKRLEEERTGSLEPSQQYRGYRITMERTVYLCNAAMHDL